MDTLLQELLACRNARYRNQLANDFIASIDSVKDLGVLYFWLKRITGSVKSTKRRVKFARKAGIVPVYAYLM